MKDCIVTVRPGGVSATYANGVYIGAFRMCKCHIKRLRRGQVFQGRRIRR